MTDYYDPLLAETFEEQADWRRQKVAEYPDDTRNLQAAEIFDRLLATANAVSAATLAKFNAVFRKNTFNAVEAWNDELRAVGFRLFPETAEECVADFVGNYRDPAATEEIGMSESALRRRANREGYSLRKSRSRSEYPTLDNYGEYMLVEVSSNVSVIGHKFDASLSDIAEFLA